MLQSKKVFLKFPKKLFRNDNRNSFSMIPKYNKNLKYTQLYEKDFVKIFKKIFNMDYTPQSKHINFNSKILNHPKLKTYRDIYVCNNICNFNNIFIIIK